MNHHYPESYHGGYARATPGMQNMGYGGGYPDQSSMARMGHARAGYPMGSYGDMRMNPMMHHQQSRMYGGYMSHQQNNPYGMGGYPHYNMPPRMNSSSMAAHQGSMRSMMGSGYYNPSTTEVSHPPSHAMQNQMPSAYSGSRMPQQQPQPSMAPPQSHPAGMAAPSPVPSQPANPQSMASSPGCQSPQSIGVHPMNQTSPHQTGSSTGYGGPGSSPYRGQSSPSMMSSSHQVPQHPMRHCGNQQNPQEVADNILQMASAYPSNQTVQVPLKSRPAPYHIPRSPHYMSSHSDLSSHLSPVGHPGQPSPSPASPSPLPAGTGGIQSPTLAPIPNPIPSPGVGDVRSPCNQGLSPCCPQQTSGYMCSSYSGHNQNYPPQQQHSDVSAVPHGSSSIVHGQQNFPPCSMPPAQTYSPYSSPHSIHSSSSCPPHSESGMIGNSNQPHSRYNSPADLSGSIASGLPYHSSLNSDHMQSSLPQQRGCSGPNMGNSPLMSLEKLVMLPETRVVDPKSVVNDACLSASSQSNDQDEGPKNGEDPAEWFVKGSDLSVGCQEKFSPLQSDSMPLLKAEEDKRTDAKEESTHNCQQGDSQSNVQTDKNVSLVQNADSRASGKVSSRNLLIQDTVSPVAEAPPQTDNFQLDLNSDKNSSNLQDLESSGQAHQENDHKILLPENLKEERPKDFKENVENKVVAQGNMKDCENSVKSISDEKRKEEEKLVTRESKETNNLTKSVNDKEKDSLSPEVDKKKAKLAKEETKCPVLVTKASSVLSEVPILPNAVSETDHGSTESVPEENEKETHANVQNGFKSLIHSKLRHTKHISPIVHTTPCSISVGARERAVCERITGRRNGYNRIRRIRSNSLGNADSDESLENVSDLNIEMSIILQPQDGNRKRSSGNLRKNDVKSSNLSNVHSPSNANVEGTKSGEKVCSSSNGTSSVNHEDVSDEETAYYEGVDNTDFFINNCSSDESLTSTAGKEIPETNSTKEIRNEKTANGVKNTKSHCNEQQDKKDSDQNHVNSEKSPQTSPSPNPPKRLRRSCTPKLSMTPETVRDPVTKPTDIEKTDVIDLTLESQEARPEKSTSLFDSKNGKKKQTPRFQPAILNRKRYPVVLLKKSPVKEGQSSAKVDSNDIKPLVLAEAKTPACDVIKGEVEKIDDISVFHSGQNIVKEEVKEDVKIIPPLKVGPKRKTQSRRKDTSRGQGRIKSNFRKDSDVKDSFKSMKFSRTLDLMKSRRKKETVSSGPFIRVHGRPSAPDTVTICNQAGPDLSSVSGKSYHGKKSKSGASQCSVSSLHIVTNLPSDKDTVVPSSHTLGDRLWSCAFCGHQSSYRSLGDLFGPYYRDSDVPKLELLFTETSAGREKRDGPASSNRRESSQGGRRGRASSKPTPPPQEIWVHSACAMWSPGVYLISGKLYGLGDAIRDAEEAQCSVCKKKGAMIGCLHKGCAMKYHVSCAMEKECYMDDENLSVLCPKHKGKKLNSVSLGDARS